MQITKSERPHIAIFGCINSGKSSVINAITNQDLAIVSDVKGTTTDPVLKSMELLPLGPVVIIDTAGINDTTDLGQLRIEKTKEVLNRTDIAILVIDSTVGETEFDKKMIEEFETKKIPYLIVHNKSDLIENFDKNKTYISAKTGTGINEFKEKLANIFQTNKKEKVIIKDKIHSGDKIILVTPIDESAPKGRLILPQQMVLRELLDAHAITTCVQLEELESAIEIIKPTLVIVDSQVFNQAMKIVPNNILLTSFSILMANYKGDLEVLVKGAEKISQLKSGDKVLISEGCTHHRQCKDIGTVKLPNWIKEFTKADLEFEFTQGGDFPNDLSKYALIVHCGGCMLNDAEMKSRIERAKEQGIGIVNYGITISYMNGVLKRALEIFNSDQAIK